MDRKVRARFYQVINIANGQSTFFDALGQLWAHPEKDSYAEIVGGLRVRIERFERAPENNGMYDGEFVRQQTDNIPPRAADDGPLEPQDDPLGHRVAFRYWPEMSVILLEVRRGAVSPAAINGLAKRRLNNHRGFFFDPTLSETALERLRGGTPRRFEMRVAKPADIVAVEHEDNEIEQNLAQLQNVFSGPNIEIAVSWPRGNRDGVLS